MNNTERIAEIRERCAAATGASWIRRNGQILCPLGSGDLLKLGGGFDANDAEFIANAREDVPFLLSDRKWLESEVARITSELEQKTRELEQCNRNDYICAVLHYNKYGDRYTFALPSQWYELEFDSFEDYQDFQMQLVFLLGAAKGKWEARRNTQAALSAEGGGIGAAN